METEKVLRVKEVETGWIMVTTCGIELSGTVFASEESAARFAVTAEPVWAALLNGEAA